jgi:hypothetical protein
MPSRDTGIPSTLKSLAIGASWAMAMRPPAPTMTNITYMTQKTGVLSTSPGVKSRRVCWIAEVAGTATSPACGARSSSATTTTTSPCPRPNQRKADSYPLDWIMLAMGITVSAEPAPKPAAVSPAARPRRSGNHFSALPTEPP